LAIENAPMYGIFLDEAEYCSPNFGTMKQAMLTINAPHHISVPVIKEKTLWAVVQMTNDTPDLKKQMIERHRTIQKA